MMILKFTTKFCIPIFLFVNIFRIVLTWLCGPLIMLIGDVGVNAGPKNKNKECFSFCRRNPNNISARNYSKLFLLKPCNSLYKFEIICLSDISYNIS